MPHILPICSAWRPPPNSAPQSSSTLISHRGHFDRSWGCGRSDGMQASQHRTSAPRLESWRRFLYRTRQVLMEGRRREKEGQASERAACKRYRHGSTTDDPSAAAGRKGSPDITRPSVFSTRVS